jgi:hypothetical protein
LSVTLETSGGQVGSFLSATPECFRREGRPFLKCQHRQFWRRRVCSLRANLDTFEAQEGLPHPEASRLAPGKLFPSLPNESSVAFKDRPASDQEESRVSLNERSTNPAELSMLSNRILLPFLLEFSRLAVKCASVSSKRVGVGTQETASLSSKYSSVSQRKCLHCFQ